MKITVLLLLLQSFRGDCFCLFSPNLSPKRSYLGRTAGYHCVETIPRYFSFDDPHPSFDGLRRVVESPTIADGRNLERKFRSAFRKLQQYFSAARRQIIKVMAVFLVVFACYSHSAWAVSGGRMGGSFGPSTRSRSVPSSTLRSPTRLPSTRIPSRLPGQRYGSDNGNPNVAIHRHYHGGTMPYYSSEAITTRLNVRDVAFLTTVGVLMAYGFTNNKRKEGQMSPLGPGATMATLTVCLAVPCRDDANSILSRLRRLADVANTNNRSSVQALVSDVVLELLREDQSIVSASCSSKHFRTSGEAQRVYEFQSLESRSKLDRELLNKYGAIERMENRAISQNDFAPESTFAIVTINLAIEGDSTRLSPIRSRKDLVEGLSKIASDANVEDCLLSAEILWAPEADWERLSQHDLYGKYPDLVPL